VRGPLLLGTNLTQGDRHQFEVALRKIDERLGCLLQWAKELKRRLTSDECGQYSDHVSWLVNTRSEIMQTIRELTPRLPQGPAPIIGLDWCRRLAEEARVIGIDLSAPKTIGKH
jgi:hypothetical protein